jgi:hypothetical protein
MYFCDKIPNVNNFKRKNALFSFTVLELSIHHSWLCCFWMRQSTMAQAAHLAVNRKQRKGGRGRQQGKMQPRGQAPSDLPPSKPTSPLPNNAVLWTHQGINPLIKSEYSGSSHFPKVQQLTVKPQCTCLWGHCMSKPYQGSSTSSSQSLPILLEAP